MRREDRDRQGRGEDEREEGKGMERTRRMYL